MTLKSYLIGIVVFFFAFHGQAQDAGTLLKNMDYVLFAPKDRQGDIKITLIAKTGKEKVREAVMYQKGPDKRLYKYTKPESQAGIATLSLPGDVMWLYMPAFGKPKKISLLAKSQAFNGTDFSYEDMDPRPYLERFQPEIVETNGNSYVLELIPTYEKSRYSKIVITLDKVERYPKFMEYYDKGGIKIKEATYTYQKTGQYWNAKEVVMTDLKKEHTTRIELSNVKLNQGLDDELFTVEMMVPPKEEKESQ